MVDLKYYITSTKEHIKKIKKIEYENHMVIYKLLGICFKFPSIVFLESLSKNIYGILSDDVLGDDCSYINYIDSYYYILQDYDLSADDILFFILSCLIPDLKVLDYTIERPYFNEDEDIEEINGFEEWALGLFDKNVDIPLGIKKSHKEWLNENMQEYTRSGEGIAFFTLVFTSPYIYDMYHDPKLSELFHEVFFNFQVEIDENTKMAYLYYGVIGYDSYGNDIQETYNFCDIDLVLRLNKYIKSKYNLKYDRYPIIKQLLKKIKLSGSWLCSDTSRFIVDIHKCFDTKDEVMF